VLPERRQEAVERFRTEAQTGARLEHDHIVTVYDVGEIDGQPFYSMRYVEGESLYDRLREGPLEGREAAKLLEPVARAVHHAHQSGILHRDLKPRNILLDADCRPYVTDFGLAKWLEAAQELTQTGEFLGTPAYMSPEQARSEVVSPASDVYSLGATLYEMLTGRPPFRAATAAETLRQIADNEPVPPRQLNAEVPRDLETICLKCLEKESAKRYATAEELAEELARYRQGRPIQARPITQLGRGWRWCKRNRALAFVGTSAAILLLVLAIGGPAFAIRFAALWERAVVGESEARKNAAAERQAKLEAKRQVLATRQALYVAHAHLIQGYMKVNNLHQIEDLLRRDIPTAGQRDLRSFEWYYWWRRYHQQRLTLDTEGHVYGLDFAGDGSFLLTHTLGRVVPPGGGYSLKVWELPSGRLRGTVHGLLGLYGLSPGGQTLTTVGYSGNVARYSLTDFREQLLFRGGSGMKWPSIVFSPDGRYVAVGGIDGSVELLDLDAASATVVAEPIELITPPGRGAGVGYRKRESRDLTFSSNGSLLAWVDANHVVGIWSVADARLVDRFNDPETDQAVGPADATRYGARIVTFSPDERYLYWNRMDGTFRRREVATSNEETIYRSHRAGPAIGYKPWIGNEGRILITSTNPESEQDTYGKTVFWDTTSGRKLAETDDNLERVAISPNGSVVAAVSQGELALWDPTSGRKTANVESVWSPKRGGTLRDPDVLPFPHLTFSPDSRTLAWANDNRTITLWDLVAKRERISYPGHASEVKALVFSPDGKTLVSGGDEALVKVWPVQDGQMSLPTPAHRLSMVTFSPKGDLLATARQYWVLSRQHGGRTAVATQELVTLHEATSGRLVLPLGTGPGEIPSWAFSSDGSRLAIAQGDNVQLWDTATGVLIARLRNGGVTREPSPNPVKNSGTREQDARVPGSRKWPAVRVAFSPDNRLLAAGFGLGIVKVWDATSLEEVFTLPGSRGQFIFLPDSKTLAIEMVDRDLALVDLSTFQETGRKSERSHLVKLIAVAPDRQTIASASENRLILWDPATFETKATLRGHTSKVTSLSFTPDGRTLASAESDGTAKLWDLATLEEKATFEDLCYVAFSPDPNGTILAGITMEGHMRLLRAATKAEVARAIASR
jgi:WD40 repeat protein/predicted Ser/Thr protein kinase